MTDDKIGTDPRATRAAALRGQLKSVLLSLAFALCLVTFGATTVGIQGDSMESSLFNGERVLVPKYEVWLHRLGMGGFERGDIVYFRAPPGLPETVATLPILGLSYHPFFIKRIVGLPGDRVSIESGRVFVNGRLLDEPYLQDQWLGNSSMPITEVPPDHVFVLGDNRGPYGSVDSRRFGAIPSRSIAGRAAVVIWPPLVSTSEGPAWNVRRLSTEGH